MYCGEKTCDFGETHAIGRRRKKETKTQLRKIIAVAALLLGFVVVGYSADWNKEVFSEGGWWKIYNPVAGKVTVKLEYTNGSGMRHHVELPLDINETATICQASGGVAKPVVVSASQTR